jgi:C-methyltransferase C-terminal domain
MMRLFEQHGFEVVDAERLPIHHGQLRATIMRRGEGTISSRVQETLAKERELRVDRFDTLVRFADQTQQIKADLTRKLAELRADGKRVVGYGAPAKGNTLIAYLELGPETIDYICDRSPLKQGRYTPNTPIPVVPAERLLEDQPDYVLVLAWNFVDEIRAQQAEYERRGGKFIVPVPEVVVLS